MKELIKTKTIELYSIRMDERDCADIYQNFLDHDGMFFSDYVYEWIECSGNVEISSDTGVYDADVLEEVMEEVENFIYHWAEDEGIDLNDRDEGLTDDDYQWLAHYFGTSIEEIEERYSSNN